MKSADWSQYSEQQIACIDLLDFAVPTHLTHVKWKKIRENTLYSLVRLGLVRWSFLYEQGSSIGLPFITLTQAGLAVQRDWRGWNASVSRKIGAIDFANPGGFAR